MEQQSFKPIMDYVETRENVLVIIDTLNREHEFIIESEVKFKMLERAVKDYRVKLHKAFRKRFLEAKRSGKSRHSV